MQSYGGKGSKVPWTGTILVVIVFAVELDMVNPLFVGNESQIERVCA